MSKVFVKLLLKPVLLNNKVIPYQFGKRYASYFNGVFDFYLDLTVSIIKIKNKKNFSLSSMPKCQINS